jgi:hypothetical protein
MEGPTAPVMRAIADHSVGSSSSFDASALRLKNCLRSRYDVQ